MYQQYYKSDFELIMKRYTYDPKATDEAEKLTPVPWPEDIDWRLKLATPHSAKPYEASCRGGVTKNCTKTEDGGILVALDNHGLACGELRYEFLFELPDPAMASGIADKYRAGSTGIMLTADATCDCGKIIDVAVVADIYKGEPFRYSDFTPEQLADLRRPAVEAAAEAAKAVEALENTVDVAEDLRAKAEEARETAETQREANEKVRQNAETQRESLFNDAHDRALAAIEAANAAVASATAAATAASDAADKCAEMIEAFETMRNEFLSRSYLLMEN